ncbi:MAG: GyrI-like domain-containing protein [Salinivirgaceae bacterium]|jgi:effector-binding domain-containing protein|nr:GyrI-like domain-containing protein [Salinivirgaceae bacterium]
MKTLKKILLALLGIIAIMLIIGLTQPSEITIERSIEIDAPLEMVYDQVNNLHNWEKWSPWHKIDTAMGLSYGNGGIGKDASYSWTSEHKSVGSGMLTIIDSKPFEFINTTMDFGDQGTGTANFKFVETDAGVKVSWDMNSAIGKNPFMRLMGIMIRKSITAAYDRGLEDIENQCEYLKETTWYSVKIKEKDAWSYYGIMSEEVNMENMQSTMEESYGKLYGELGKANIEPGTAFAVYYSWGETFKMECGVSVQDNSTTLKNIDSKEIPKQTYAVLKLIGSYDGLMGAHEYMGEWLAASNKKLNGPVIEKYKVGPPIETDMDKWVTYVLYPIVEE